MRHALCAITCCLVLIGNYCFPQQSISSDEVDGLHPSMINRAGSLPIRNYSYTEYHAGQTNLAVIQDKRGIMYFGNEFCVLEYDGVSWRSIPVTNESSIRSFSMDRQGVIYVGAQGEFGTLEPDHIGKLHYRSLLSFVNEKDRDFADVWSSFATNKGIYFQSSNKIFRWKNQRIKIWDAETAFHVMFNVNNDIYVRQWNLGLMKMVGDTLVLGPGGEQFADIRIYAMLLLKGITKLRDKIIILTRGHGLFTIPVKHVGHLHARPWQTMANDFLLNTTIYNGIFLNNNSLSIGTLDKGAAVIDSKGFLTHILNKYSGLQDESIFGQYFDSKNNLWFTLDNGISKVEINSPLTFFGNKDGLEGTVESVVRHDGILYVATASGLYYSESKNSSTTFQPVTGIETECWNLLSILPSEQSEESPHVKHLLLYKEIPRSPLPLYPLPHSE